MKFPYFPFFVKDFSADSNVEAMALNEVGAYVLLLCKAWQEDPPGTLPNDDRKLAAWSKLYDHWTEHKTYIMAPFTLESDNRWHQKRMEREFSYLCSRNAKASDKARDAAERRWKKGRMLQACKTDAPSIEKTCTSNAQAFEHAETEIPKSEKNAQKMLQASKSNAPSMISDAPSNAQAMLEQCNSNSNSNIYITAEFPKVEEVIQFGQAGPLAISKGKIPEDFCRYYFNQKQDKDTWLNGYGRLVNWKSEIHTWWTGRKATWEQEKFKHAANKPTRNDRNAGTLNAGKSSDFDKFGKAKKGTQL